MGSFDIGQLIEVKSYTSIKEVSKVIGYFSCSDSGHVLCEGEACVIGDTEERMQIYLKRAFKNGERDTIKKARFG